MAKRAQQGSVARCPYCEASLPQVAPECPQCRFPLTMDAADSGLHSGDRSGTTSTATPGWRATPSVLPGSAAAAERARVHGSRGHRMRVAAWLLGVTSILLLLAGVGALFTATSAGAKSDRVARISLINAVRTPDPTPRTQGEIVILAADEPSDAPEKVSVDAVGDLWFGAARSVSGTCHILALRLTDRTQIPGSLAKDDPCTAAEVRRRSQKALREP